MARKAFIELVGAYAAQPRTGVNWASLTPTHKPKHCVQNRPLAL
jgi:hypothetical protein